MWDSGNPAIATNFYLDIKEDFDLNLKLGSEGLDDAIQKRDGGRKT